MTHRDFADHLVEQWATARPDLDGAPMEFVVRTIRVAALLEKRLERLVEGHGMALWEFDVLATLRRNPGGLQPKRLMREMLLSSGAMTHRIDRLTADGLVRRVADPGDRRGVIVRITARGRKRVDPIVEARFADARAVHDLLGAEEVRSASDALRNVSIELQEEDW